MKTLITSQGRLHHRVSLSLLLVFLNFSSPWILISHASLTSLPGFPGYLPFSLETGYVGVGESDADQLFYYFVESESNPREDPLVLWLTGGPGCSAWSGFVYEIGPLLFETAKYNFSGANLPTLTVNPYSWTKVASIIFLDAPVWTGFSYSKNPNFNGTGDFDSCNELRQFLRKWLISHPQFLTNPLYIGGDSYSGITVPVVAQEISLANEAGQEPILNLKGYLIGNPATDHKFDGGAIIPYLHGVGIISDELYENAKIKCEGDFTREGDEECTSALTDAYQCMMGLNNVHILEPLCFFAAKKSDGADEKRSLQEISSFKSFPIKRDPLDKFNPIEVLSQAPSTPQCRSFGYLLSYVWANEENVRRALGIRKGSINQWIRCNYSIPYTKDIESALPYHLNLTTKGFRALAYSGDHDASVPHVGTHAWIRSLNFSITDDWRSWSVDGQIAGYTRSFANNMTFATIKGGGHTAPEYKPKEALAMFHRWISNEPL